MCRYLEHLEPPRGCRPSLCTVWSPATPWDSWTECWTTDWSILWNSVIKCGSWGIQQNQCDHRFYEFMCFEAYWAFGSSIQIIRTYARLTRGPLCFPGFWMRQPSIQEVKCKINKVLEPYAIYCAWPWCSWISDGWEPIAGDTGTEQYPGYHILPSPGFSSY